MKAKLIKGNSTKDIKTALEDHLQDGYEPTLAFVFISVKQNIKQICHILDEKGITIYGTTTNGEIAGDEITEGAISILLSDLDKTKFIVLLEEYKSVTTFEASQNLAIKAKEHFTNPTFLIACSDFQVNYTNLLNGFSKIVGEQVNVFGGVAGDDITMTNDLLVFTNNKSSERGVVAVVFDESEVDLKGKVFCGWNPVGTIKTITKSEGNKIYEIDGKTALDLTLKYGGIKKLPDDYNESVLLVSRTLAMQFLRDEGEPVTLIGLIDKEDGSMIVHQDIPVGTKMRFVLPPDFEVVDEICNSFEELKTAVPDPDAVLVYSCSARIDVLGPIVNDEIKEIYKIWDVPMAGFFCNGELARANNGNLEMHNLTACGVVLKEKK